MAFLIIYPDRIIDWIPAEGVSFLEVGLEYTGIYWEFYVSTVPKYKEMANPIASSLFALAKGWNRFSKEERPELRGTVLIKLKGGFDIRDFTRLTEIAFLEKAKIKEVTCGEILQQVAEKFGCPSVGTLSED